MLNSRKPILSREILTPTLLGLVLLLLFDMSACFVFAEITRAQPKRVENYIAVFDIEVVGKVDKDISRPLSDSIRREIIRSGRYEVIDRSNMDKILNEQAFQMTGCTQKDCAVEAGQMLGVGKIVIGTISKVGQTYYLSLSMVNVESGKTENVEEDTCRCELDDLIMSSKRVAARLLGSSGVNGVGSIGKSDSLNTTGRVVETSNDRFDVYSKTIFDKKINIVWTKSANVASKSLTRIEAEQYVDALNEKHFAGANNWRFPTADEIESLVVYAKQKGLFSYTYTEEAETSKKAIGEFYAKFGITDLVMDVYWLSAGCGIDIRGKFCYVWDAGKKNDYIYYERSGNKCYLWLVHDVD
ncbi:MAG: DUF1566 domain-containing protein [Nitrospiraceae bacterium]|nr:DUF1566 domain-containing protein [Nitrospiraceae bacterium]